MFIRTIRLPHFNAVDDGGSGGATWHETLPEEFKTHPTLKPHFGKPLDGLVKSYVEAQKMLGSALKVPGDMATAEERSAFWAKVGRPEAPDKYELKDPDGFDPKGLPDEFRASFRKQAFEAGMTKEQAQAAWGFYLGETQKARSAWEEHGKKQVEATRETLRKEWSSGFDAKVKDVNKGAALFGEKLQEKVLAMAAQDADFAKALAGVGAAVSEDTTRSSSGGGELTKEQAAAKITEIMGNKDHPYHSKLKPGHREAVAEMQRLFEIKVGVARSAA